MTNAESILTNQRCPKCGSDAVEIHTYKRLGLPWFLCRLCGTSWDWNSPPKEGGKTMLKKVPKMCVTCQYYEPYHCTMDDSYIGYLYCDVPTKCKAYSLSDDYRRGGKFYESRKMDVERREGYES